jgi:aminoglycoside phosphotransferase (APT) family kinase protein
MNERTLTGHSGCDIRIIFDISGSKPFVRKTSPNVEYNARLERQCSKQREYKSSVLHSPEVIGSGYDERGLFYFDMGYIRGIVLSEYIKTVSVSQIAPLVNKLLSGHDIHDSGAGQDISAFADKIESLEGKAAFSKSENFSGAVRMLKSYDWSRFKKSWCHGDLTFENIIVGNGELYLIDFLDSFYDCRLLDVGKLLQDAQTMWSYRQEQSIDANTRIRLKIFRDLVLHSVCRGETQWFLDVYYALLLHLTRIYPYTNDFETVNFLDTKIESVLRIIDEAEEAS